jgi:hypothetical protein
LIAAFSAVPGIASAEFSFVDHDATITNADGSPVTQAGSHPFAVTTSVMISSHESTGPSDILQDEALRDLFVDQPPGLIGDASAGPKCPITEFASDIPKTDLTRCPDNTAVGVAAISLIVPGVYVNSPVYNLEPPPGVPVMIGLNTLRVRTTIKLGLRENPTTGKYNVVATTTNFPQSLRFFGAAVQLWGDPTDPAHDPVRGICVGTFPSTFTFGVNFAQGSTGNCPVEPGPPFITMPRSCAEPMTTYFEGDSWGNTGTFVHAVDQSPTLTGCERLNFKPTIGAAPTSDQAESPTGMDFALNLHDEGLKQADALAQSDFKKVTVRLPEGMTINPSIAEGLQACTPADYERETIASEPGEGCPNSSKIGSVRVISPLVNQDITGSLYVAEQDDPATTEKGAENPFDSLLAMYIVLRNPQLGILIKQPAKVEPDPRTGRLTTVVDDIPQVPFSKFTLHFREGARSPLTMPPACGEYAIEADLVPWADPSKVVGGTSLFRVTAGSGGSSCPGGGKPPFKPGLFAGTVNNAAGQYSPFDIRLTRNDGEQEFTDFSIKLPPGVIGKLAGIPFCSDGAIEAAKSKTGTAELASPSCPAASEVGRTLVGAGVGSSLTYVPGKVYLAGSYHGSPLSVAAITSAKVGPFDLGTVIVREALRINPDTAEVFVDPTGSDPIPHIIKGIPVHARDIRVYVDRPQFVLNPTDCSRTSTASTLLGSGLDFASTVDDEPVTVSTPFQAASCASLGFKPRLTLRLKGGTKRSANPALTAVVKPRPGDANIGGAVVALPHSEFLDNEHIGTVCTRVQFNAGGGNGEQCPAGSIYGRAKATTPLLDEELSGPVFLRSSSHQLPDLVVALHSGKINVNLDGRIDSTKRGGIRTTFEGVPDAPVTQFTLEMFGGKKSLLINSTNLCKRTKRATARFEGQNGKVHSSRPALKVKCGGKKKHGRRG